MKITKYKLALLLTLTGLSLPTIIACAPNDQLNKPGNGLPPGQWPPINPLVPGIISNFTQESEISGTHHFTMIQNSEHFGLLAITQEGQLLKYEPANDKWVELAKDLDPNSPLYAARGKISMVTKDGNYALYEDQKITYSNIAVSKKGGFAHLGFASIVVAKENDKYYLARVEKSNNTLVRSAILKTRELLETSVPVQVNFNSQDNSNGHIAVLAQPTQKYSHYVLGINQNADELIFVERHDLKNLASPLKAGQDAVFEDNQPRIITLNGKNYLAVIKSSLTQGGSVAIVGQKGNELAILSQTPYIGLSNRWNSPMVVHNRLLVTKTPHIGGSTYSYDFGDLTSNPTEAEFVSGISPHKIGQSKTANYSFNQNYLFVPANNGKDLVIVKLDDKKKIIKSLNFAINNIIGTEFAIFVHLANGKIISYR